MVREANSDSRKFPKSFQFGLKDACLNLKFAVSRAPLHMKLNHEFLKQRKLQFNYSYTPWISEQFRDGKLQIHFDRKNMHALKPSYS